MGAGENLEHTISSEDKKESLKFGKFETLLKIISRCSKEGGDVETIKRDYAEHYVGQQSINNRAEFTEKKKEAEDMLKVLYDKKHYLKREDMPSPGSTHLTKVCYKLTQPLGDLLNSLTELT